MTITPKNYDAKEPKLCDFSHKSMTNPPIHFLELKMAKKGFYSIFVVGGNNFRCIKFGYLAFFEANMTKIVIIDQKIIFPDNYQQFWVHFEMFLSLSNFGCKTATVTVKTKIMQKWYSVLKSYFQINILWNFGPPPLPM